MLFLGEGVTLGAVKGDPTQGCTHFEPREARGTRGVLTSLQDHSADALPSPVRMHEECANLGSIVGGVEERILSAVILVPSVQGMALAPSPARDKNVRSRRSIFDGEVSAVGDELAVDAINASQGAFDLQRIVEVRLKPTNGSFDDLPESRHIGRSGLAKLKRQSHGIFVARCKPVVRFEFSIKIDDMTSLLACAILFDFDGVLVDSTAVVAAQYTRWAREHGLDAEALVNFAHGVRTIEVVRRWTPHLDAEEETRRIEEREALDPAVVVMPGALSLLQSIPPGRWGIVTSGGRLLASTRIRVLRLPEPAVLVTADDVSRGKPDPEPYRKGAEQLGCKPADCVVIEDALAGIRSAHAAGAKVISLPTTYSLEELKEADYVVAGLERIRVNADGGLANSPLHIELESPAGA